jgi:predicted nucleic acid-binding protein
MAQRRTTFLADASALHRLRQPAVARRLVPLLEQQLVATCAIVDLEILYSARNAEDHEVTRERRAAFIQAPVTPTVLRRAIDVQGLLARRGQHRLPIEDLIIAAAAEIDGHVVLHYDAHYERIAAVSGQPHEWVVPRGSI